MHEMALSSAIVQTVLRYAEGRRVSVVTVNVGALRQVVPSSLSFYFEIVARETVVQDAKLELELIDALLRCPYCEREWDPAPAPALDEVLMPSFRCPTCGEAAADTLTGNEFEVDSIEVEQPEKSEHPLLS
ncbi:hydrogenase maturation nickel metallochaperone HypA [soil metagenome]